MATFGPSVLAFGERQYNLPDLDALADGLASTLAQGGVGSGQRVAVMSSNRPELVAAVRAIWRLGAAVVLLSPAWKRVEVDHALAVTTPTQAVGDHPVLAGLMPMLHYDDPMTSGHSTSVPPHPDADAVLVFSSGTTGMPKAVRHTHRSFGAAIRHWRDALQMTAADRMQIVTPVSHILGLLNVMTALDTGAWVRLHSRFDVDAMLHHIEADRITVEMAVAPIALALASHRRLESVDMSSLRYIMWCATPVTPGVAEEITRRTGVGWLTAYGTTELPVIACSVLGDVRLDTVGRPVSGVSVRVVSLKTGEPVGIGDLGEIQARSESLMAGYLPREANVDAICDGWYRTGDVGSLDPEGFLAITDRSKEMIKVRGFQVAPAEIEAVLHGHPAVSDCAVFSIPDPVDGEAIVAAVATRTSVTSDELIDLVGVRLASYKRPAEVVFVPQIPRLPSGKVLRRVLKERYGCTSDK
jgi:acyl-CoA synthetase (AMP-forming)/AMP-acid ligase II